MAHRIDFCGLGSAVGDQGVGASMRKRVARIIIIPNVGGASNDLPEGEEICSWAQEGALAAGGLVRKSRLNSYLT